MIKIIVSIYDKTAELFNDPRQEVNTASAIRAFEDTVKEHPHKNDFVLYQLGAFDSCKGTILPNEPLKICSGFELSNSAEVIDMPDHLKQQSGK